MADFCYLKPSLLTDYYKNHLSDFHSWDQKEHAEDYIIFPDNIGENMSLDETALSNGELVTNLTNKDGHGKKGTIVAIIKGTSSETVNACLEKIPEQKRKKVKNITLDMAGSMCRIARHCFPEATQIIDRFHVQQEMYDALQDLRVQYRWQAQEEENLLKKQAKKKEEEYESPKLENKDTRKQLLRRSRYLLFKSPSHWTDSQKTRAEILFREYDDIKQLYYLSLQLGQIYSTSYDKDIARVKLALWFNKVEEWEYPQFNTVIQAPQKYRSLSTNLFSLRVKAKKARNPLLKC